MNRIHQILLILYMLLLAFPATAQLMTSGEGWDEANAMNHSQEAVGRVLGDHEFTDTNGSRVSLSDYAGKPLLISLVFTSCHHVCPMTTRRLAEAVDAARDVLEEDSFNVLTIGFDTANDTTQAMAAFARQQSVAAPRWVFLSADAETIATLTTELGFIYYPTPRGFDHITQVSVVDRDSTVYRQVYGVQFELPWLVEPLKELVFNRPTSAGRPVAGLLDRIRLFCTVYDPSSGRYHFDYSLFIQMAIGMAAILSLAWFLFSGMRRKPES